MAAGYRSRVALSPSRPAPNARSRMSFLLVTRPKQNTLASKDDSRVFPHAPLRHVSQDEISGFYLSVAAPLLERAGLSPSERGFRHAYALVSSRAFMVDAYHGLAMVPIADAWVMTSFVR